MKNIFSAVWPEWEAVKELGRGSYGVVYEAVRRDHQMESRAAIKVISIPQSESEVESLCSEGLTRDATKTYFQGVVNNFVNEIQLMESLKGVPNIVNVEDYKVVEKQDGVGWTIYIRMELLTSFNNYSRGKVLSEDKVIKLGRDICTALEFCAKRNIIHRDIKPENIFVNDFGDFKLGDFGIARTLESSTGALSQKGTFNYMAPEVYKGTKYDARVDIYSLGLVLYRLMNDNRLPFLMTEQQQLNPNERAAALKRRMEGEPLPPPRSASPDMAQLILCACAYRPEGRFASATALKNALAGMAGGANAKVTNIPRQQDYDATVRVRKAPQAAKSEAQQPPDSGKKKKSKVPAMIASVLTVVFLLGAAFLAVRKFAGGDSDTDSSAEDTSLTSADNSDIYAFDESSDSSEANASSEPYENEELQEIRAIVEEAETLAISGNNEGALAKVKAALAIYPDSNVLSQKADEYAEAILAQKKKNTLDNAASLADSGDYVSAINLIKEALKDDAADEDYKNAQKTYSNAYKQDALARADKQAADQNYTAAADIIDSALAVLGDDTELKAKLQTYKTQNTTKIRSDAITESNALKKEHKYPEALDKLKAALKTLENDAELQAKYDNCVAEYASYVSEKADELVDEDWDAAYQLVLAATEKLPDNEKLADLKERILSVKPAKLTDLVVVDSSQYKVYGAAEEVYDSYGNRYTGCPALLMWYYHGSHAYAIYNLSQKYTDFSCSLAPIQNFSSDKRFTLKIYTDDDLVFEKEIKKTTTPFKINVKVADATLLKIQIDHVGGGDDGGLIIADGILKNNIDGE